MKKDGKNADCSNKMIKIETLRDCAAGTVLINIKKILRIILIIYVLILNFSYNILREE